MKTKRPLADVLWEAANEHLLPTAPRFGDQPWYSFSCNAAAEAAGQDEYEAQTAVERFLEELGVYPCRDDYTFGTRQPGPKRQGVRYMWLLLAMHVAEDEGIEVEVYGGAT
jgi:hypothetical protein